MALDRRIERGFVHIVSIDECDTHIDRQYIVDSAQSNAWFGSTEPGTLNALK
jgi:hypothetical protein